jgi:hypothetical protein
MNLMQWDKSPDYTAPAFSGGPDKPAHTADTLAAEARTLSSGIISFDTMEISGGGSMSREDAESLFKHPGALISAKPDYSADYVAALLESVEQWKAHASDEALRATYWHKEYKAETRRYWWMLSFAAVNGACLVGAVWQLVNR